MKTESYGGYDGAERQMVAFIPDALYYEWDYPLCGIQIAPAYPKFAETLTHRDILGALMHLGIERNRLGDIICKPGEYYIFCEQEICPFILEQLTNIRHTAVRAEQCDLSEKAGQMLPEFDEHAEMVASNRIDAIIARAYHLSRSESAVILAEEKVFLNGRKISNCNESCHSGDIISVRGKGRFIFETDNLLTKKGKLKVNLKFFK